MNLANEPVREYTKAQQVAKTRIKLSQRQLGEITAKVRKEVRTRSGGVCEVRERCKGAPAVQQAHITSRRRLNHRTTAADLLDSCIACHRFLDESPEGIRYKRQLEEMK